ncbi:MAG: M67 family metallopeptidase [Dehalococcoidia bacterium]
MPEIARAIVDEMIAHAREELPNECCGMVHARDGVPVAVHRVTNDAASPYRYEMNPLQMMRLESARDQKRRRRVPRGQPGAGRFAPGSYQETLFAIYHSHVASEARPSPTDVRMAFFPPGEFGREPMFPDTYYIVISLASEPPSVRAFHVRTGGVVEEEPIAIVEA